MRQYIIRRILISLLVLFGVSIVLYTLVRLMPSDYITNITIGRREMPAEHLHRLRELYGLDVPPFQGYIDWIKGVFSGDFGISFIYQRPVNEVIGEKMMTSFSLASIAFVLELLIGIPFGIISATKQYSKLDYGVTVFALIGISIPSFFMSALLQRVFALGLRWFPLSGMVTARARYTGFMLVLDIAYHFVLPVVVLTVINVGVLMRYSRTNMLEVVNADYIRTARAKGLSERTVIYKHAFRNTLIPIVTYVGGAIPTLFTGAIITERIFAIDGLGSTAFQALTMGDIPFIMAFNMFVAVMTLLGNLISDILYAVVDPRIRYN